MKKEYKILFVLIIGILVLFFFPEPQTNFIYYVLTILIFIGFIILIVKKDKSRRKR